MPQAPVTFPQSPRARLWARLCLAALVVVSLGPFLANTSPAEKSRMAIKAVAIAAALAYLALNRARIRFRGSLPSAAAGLALILIAGGLTLSDVQGIIREPGLGFILGALGVSLIACGRHVSAIHARAGGLFALAALPAARIENLIEHGLDYSTVVAGFSAFSMHYIGLDVQRVGNTILHNGRAVEIIAECSGLKLFFLLFAFFLILLLALPELKRIFWRMLFAALGTGFVISVLRIDFLVLIVGQTELFEFFHHGMGSELISMVAILVFGFFIKEEVFTALEKRLPAPPIPDNHLPASAVEGQLRAALIAACVVGTATAVGVYLLGASA